MPYLWAAHPQFLAGADCQIILPPEVTEVVNTMPVRMGLGPRGGPLRLARQRRRTAAAVRLD